MKKALTILLVLVQFINLSAQQKVVDSVLNALRKSTTDSEKFQNTIALADYYQGTRQDSSWQYLRQGIKMAVASNKPWMLMKAYTEWGFNERIDGDYGFALKLELKALSIADSIKDTIHMCSIYNLLGNAYREYNEYDNAKKYYLLEKQWGATEKRFDVFIFSANVNLGLVYSALNKPDSALACENDAYNYSIKNNSYLLSQVTGILAQIQMNLDNRNVAYDYFMMSVSGLKKSYGNNKILSTTYLDIANFYKKYHVNDSAMYYAHKSLSGAKGIPYLKGISDASKFLADSYDSLHNADSELVYLKQFMTTNDSIYSQRKALQVENTTIMESLHEQEKQQELEKEQQERKENLQYAGIALGIIAFMSLFLLLTRSLVVSPKIMAFLGIIGLLMVFEFLNLFLHNFLEKITNHTPVLMLLALVIIAAILTPLHHWVEHKAVHSMVERNKAKRDELAKKASEEHKKQEAQ